MLVYRAIVKRVFWFYYYTELERHFPIVFYTNMAVSSREWKPRISADKGLTLETSAFQIFHGSNSTFINSFDHSKFSHVQCCWIMKFKPIYLVVTKRKKLIRYGLQLVRVLGPLSRKVPKLSGRLSCDTILFVSSKGKCLEARNFAVILIFIPFTTYPVKRLALRHNRDSGLSRNGPLAVLRVGETLYDVYITRTFGSKHVDKDRVLVLHQNESFALTKSFRWKHQLRYLFMV